MAKRILTESEKKQRAEYYKKYSAANKEKLKAKDARRWERKGKEICEAKKKLRAKLKDESPEEYEKLLEIERARLREYNHANKEEVNRKQKEYRESRKDWPELRRAYRGANKDRINELRKKSPHYQSEKTLVLARIYRENNKEKVQERTKNWRKANPEKVLWHIYQREQKILQATIGGDKWKNEILAIYKECARITKETGTPHHVDHVAPLKGKFVSGLHVYWNLRIITAEENMKKKNKFIQEIL